jgi:hypothetical protein
MLFGDVHLFLLLDHLPATAITLRRVHGRKYVTLQEDDSPNALKRTCSRALLLRDPELISIWSSYYVTDGSSMRGKAGPN